jgi:hypothetical protein
MGPELAIGQEQQGHRRRRRRRKNKSSQSSAAPAQQTQLPQTTAQTLPPPPPQRAPKHRQPQPQGRRQDAQPNQSRKKKAFVPKNSNAGAQPGNSSSVQSQRKRKGTQKGPREFVGPMDHSYRVVNGNVADGPPSTIQLTSNGRNGGGQYMDVYQPAPLVAVCPDAVPRIYCFIEDLFFVAKIQETARKLGVKVEFVKGDKDIVGRLADLPEDQRPKLLVFDLNNLNAKPISLIPKFKAKFKKATSIIGFLNHLQGELKAKAIEAGCDSVMPRSAFSQTLPNLLRRYGVEEEEDNTPQPM